MVGISSSVYALVTLFCIRLQSLDILTKSKSVSFDKIGECQADRAYCSFYLIENRTIYVSKPMKGFEEGLNSKNFLKVLKSTIVNIGHVEKFIRGKSGYLLMSDGSTVNVSFRKKEELLNLLKRNA